MNTNKSKLLIKTARWIGQYSLVAFVTVFAFYGARSYVGTKFELLKSNLNESQLPKIISLIESENVPYQLSVDRKRIRVPDYTIPRLQYKIDEVLAKYNLKGGY